METLEIRLEANELLVRALFLSLRHANPEFCKVVQGVVEVMAQEILDQKPQAGWPLSIAGARMARSTVAELMRV